MTEKELKKLTRSELLEMLRVQTRCTEELEARLEETKRKLKDKTLTISNAGSIAEAALQVSGIFEAAEAAAKQYLDNIKACSERSDKMLAETRQRCTEMEKKALEKFTMLKADMDELHLKWIESEPTDSDLSDSVLEQS